MPASSVAVARYSVSFVASQYWSGQFLLKQSNAWGKERGRHMLCTLLVTSKTYTLRTAVHAARVQDVIQKKTKTKGREREACAKGAASRIIREGASRSALPGFSQLARTPCHRPRRRRFPRRASLVRPPPLPAFGVLASQSRANPSRSVWQTPPRGSPPPGSPAAPTARSRPPRAPRGCPCHGKP